MQNNVLTINKIFENVEFFKQNSEHGYVKTINEIIRSDPFLGHKFYIHSFVKRIDDDSGIKKMIHHPRLTKPAPTPGATLLRVDPKQPSEMKIMWTLPNQETFGLYKYGKVFADNFVWECINTFKKHPEQFMKKESDDLNDDQILEIYKDLKMKKDRVRVTANV